MKTIIPSLITTLSAVIFLVNNVPAIAQERSDKVLDSLLRALSTAKEDTNKTKLIYRIAERYGHTDEKAHEKYIHMGKAHAEKVNFPRATAVFINMLGSLKHNKGDIDSTLWYYNEAYRLHEALGNEKGMAGVLVDISNVYNWQGKNAEAMAYLTKATPVLERIKDYENLAIAYGNFSNLYVQEENYEKALAYELKALKAIREGKRDHLLASCYNHLGNIYLGTKDTARAKDYYLRAIDAAKQHHRDQILATAYQMIQECTHNYSEKLDYLFKSKAIWEVVNPEHPVATSVTGDIGKIYLELAENPTLTRNADDPLIPRSKSSLLKLSRQYLEETLAICKKNKITQNLMYYLGIKSRLEAAARHYEQAYEDLSEHLVLYDSLYSQENKNKISQIESANELLLKDQEIAQHENRMKEMWLYGIITLFVVILIFTFFLYRNKVNNLMLKNSLASQQARQKEAELMLQNRIMESELKVIRAQMNPHFIFNVLNNIESYVLDNDRKTASRLIQKFAKLSRLILENSTQNLVPLARDWQGLQLYVELEALRFNHQFTYSFRVDERVDASRWLIPPMLIQPIVENAIHHGLRASSVADKNLDVDVCMNDEQLVFSISDNGVGFSRSKDLKITKTSYKEKSIGLDSVRERLELFNLYKSTSKAYMVMQDKEAGASGTIVQIFFPLLEAEDK